MTKFIEIIDTETNHPVALNVRHIVSIIKCDNGRCRIITDDDTYDYETIEQYEDVMKELEK